MSRPTVHLPPKVEQAGDVQVITFDASGVRDVEDGIAGATRENKVAGTGKAGIGSPGDPNKYVYSQPSSARRPAPTALPSRESKRPLPPAPAVG